MQGNEVVSTYARTITDEDVDAGVKLDHQHSIRPGPPSMYRGSRVRVRDKPFTRIRIGPCAALKFLIHRCQRRSIAR